MDEAITQQKIYEQTKLRAEEGEAKAQCQMGAWYEGNVNAVTGVIFLEGFKGVPVDFVKAVEWYTKAADQADTDALYRLGIIHKWGKPGVAKDYAKAKDYFSQAAELGCEWSQKELTDEKNWALDEENNRGAELYNEGKYEEAFAIWKKLAEQGFAGAQNNVAVCYGTGQGTAKDDVKATEWYRKAAAQGNEDARKALEEIDNEPVYEGPLVDGKKHGKGKMTWPNGELYEGDWVNDQRAGKGKYTWPNGAVYEGDWVNDKRHGRGKQIVPDGRVFDGRWENDEFVDGSSSGGSSSYGSSGGGGKKSKIANIIGAVAGAVVLSFIIPPIGTIAGAVAGWFVGDMIAKKIKRS